MDIVMGFRLLFMLVMGIVLMSGCAQTAPAEEASEPAANVTAEPPVVKEPIVNGTEEAPSDEAAGKVNETEGTADAAGPVDETEAYDPQINASDFTSNVDNPFFTLTPGMTFVYEAETEEGTEMIEVSVTNETREVMGVMTVVVWDRVWFDGELIEDTKDWYAQDNDGNVWYFGEESKEYVTGKLIGTEGSWESGIDGAKPGIIMGASPRIGDSYRQEYYEGEAEDMGEVLAMDQSVTVPYGSFYGCLKTRDWTPLEPGAEEYKYYCPEVGFVVLEVAIEDGERVELVNITHMTTEAPQEPQEELQKDITEQEAIGIALEAVPGEVTDVAIEKKFGGPAYVIEIDADDGGETDVIIDIATGDVLGIET